ncbi:MAG: hypothetical protein LBI63_03135 [Candidatus Ancillula sp.]|nr:hypothetical protein [Candidatus Ancillula sp.]
MKRLADEFIYKSYEYKLDNGYLHIKYRFEIPGVEIFEPSWKIPYSANRSHEVTVSNDYMDELVFNLGLVELVSYWKSVCAQTVKIECSSLSAEQILWWKKLYFYGLGEFFYQNNIVTTVDDFMHIVPRGEKTTIAKFAFSKLEGSLVPIGGGKDSIVSLNSLLDATADDKIGTITPYIINSRGATLDTVRIAGLEQSTVFASRYLDERLLELNKRGFLNGHTPFSAVVAFSALIAAFLNGRKYIVLSNESSANEPTVVDRNGISVNHQYSKSFEFESEFRYYVKRYLTTTNEYFSLLRPLSEYQIAKTFSKLKNYHAVFRSCNVGSKRNVWCTSCPKCLFVYIILAPFLDVDELVKIFGENLFEKSELKDDLNRLVGVTETKPFECVGSIDEVNTALVQVSSQYSKDSLPYLLRQYSMLQKYQKYKQELDEKLNYYNKFYDEGNAVPPNFKELLLKGIN